MVYLTAEGISKAFGERVLFKDLNITISEGDKIGLVARNGAGKTSFLRILTQKELPDSGAIKIHKDVTVGYLSQDTELNENATILDTVLYQKNPITEAIQKYELAIEHSAKHHDDASNNQLHDAMMKMDALNAWDYENDIKKILSSLKITDLEREIKTLSGGQKKRVALAQILIMEPGLMILDEPTNHLDIEMIEWLEEYLNRKKMTLLLVTHDRYFLDRITDEINELDDYQLYRYKGNYSYYLEKKAEREFNQGRETDKAKSLYRKELEWMRRQPKARTTKSKSRIDDFYVTEEKAHRTKEEVEIKLDIKMNRQGGKIIEMKHVNKAFGDLQIVKGFTYTFSKGEKVGIVGPNGIGKSTFLNLITGKDEPDTGKINVGDTTVFGYFTQEGIKLAEDKRVIEVVKDIAEVIPLSSGEKVSASQFLKFFGFNDVMQYTPVSKLSGGEKRRLHLMTVLIKNPNFLILDEPTNDLDLITLTTLEEFLQHFGGCLLIVSHDRYFMDKLVKHLFVFEGNGEIRDFNGTYSEYRTEQLEKEKAEKKGKNPPKNIPAPVQVSTAPEKKKVAYKDKREYELLDSEIPALEAKKKELETKLSDGNASHKDISEWAKDFQRITKMIDEKTTRWLELAEMM
ncbi:MAG: ABC-F family ATP-binding cassette domain-containing protein [Bacteroidetes bacterium]|nr:ABC-F family ATP-binding cassette domain-containing protein [Bacteroidota bacterium]